MRDYLYIWHDPEQQFLVVSGIEFKDFLPSLTSQGGIVLVDHQSETADYDTNSSLNFVPASKLSELATENIYSWGNFVWADYAGAKFPSINNEEVAELLFFAHKAKPLHRIALPNLSNRFLCYAHDDGWYLQLYYTSWDHIDRLIVETIPTLGASSISGLKQGTDGFWLRGGKVHKEEKTHDVDKVLNRRL